MEKGGGGKGRGNCIGHLFLSPPAPIFNELFIININVYLFIIFIIILLFPFSYFSVILPPACWYFLFKIQLGSHHLFSLTSSLYHSLSCVIFCFLVCCGGYLFCTAIYSCHRPVFNCNNLTKQKLDLYPDLHIALAGLPCTFTMRK